MTLEEAKNNLLQLVNTPLGRLKLYGINLLPDNGEAFGLIFYLGSKQRIFYSIDCSVVIDNSEGGLQN